jgi:hypothetical protein
LRLRAKSLKCSKKYIGKRDFPGTENEKVNSGRKEVMQNYCLQLND